MIEVFKIQVEGYEADQRIPTYDNDKKQGLPTVEVPRHWAGKNVVVILTDNPD